MLFEFGTLQVDIDVDKTRKFYETARLVHEKCSCDACQNFEGAIATLPDTIKNFFAEIGIDMRKACECYTYMEPDGYYCTNADGTVPYGGWYHICGSIVKAENSNWIKLGENTVEECGQDSLFIFPSFHVYFSENIALPEKNFPTPVLQVTIEADLPWVLSK